MAKKLSERVGYRVGMGIAIVISTCILALIVAGTVKVIFMLFQ